MEARKPEAEKSEHKHAPIGQPLFVPLMHPASVSITDT
jgi:hypothetical protein